MPFFTILTQIFRACVSEQVYANFMNIFIIIRRFLRSSAGFLSCLMMVMMMMMSGKHKMSNFCFLCLVIHQLVCVYVRACKETVKL